MRHLLFLLFVVSVFSCAQSIYGPSATDSTYFTIEGTEGIQYSKYEVTNAEYSFFLEDLKKKGTEIAPYERHSELWSEESYGFEGNEPFMRNYHWHPAFDDYPVVNISHEAALAYCTWLTEKTAKPKKGKSIVYRLPTYEEFMKLMRFFSSVTITYKNKYNHQGPILVRKLKKVSVSKDGSIQYLLCYIHHNPIHHGLVVNFDQWQYSSYNSYVNKVGTKIAKNEMLDWLGNIDAFNKIHQDFKMEKQEINLDEK